MRRSLWLPPVLALAGFALGVCYRSEVKQPKVPVARIEAAESLAGLKFNDKQRAMMGGGLADQRTNYEHLRAVPLPNAESPMLVADVWPDGYAPPADSPRPAWKLPETTARPAQDGDLAYLTLREQAWLLKTRWVTSEQLTRVYLERIKKYDPAIKAVITVTEARALREARAADAEIQAGKWRGPLHGIPYGAKDLIAAPDYPTTWGAPPYRAQIFSEEAAVVTRLRDAGAVLIAKTSLGELAMDDVWFGGRTNNPWNLKRGSSGSSAGSAAGMAAGFFSFAIGSETWGSIVSPGTECGVTGLRPTYGAVPRTGAMALSWSMDKLGPLCRDAADCAIVYDAIRGPDGRDRAAKAAPFAWPGEIPLSQLRVGYMRDEFAKAKVNAENDRVALLQLKELGARELVPLELPKYPIADLSIMLTAEAAAAFDDLTRSGRDRELVQQGDDRWPNIFRMSRFIPAVEYLQAARIRRLLINDLDRQLRSKNIDVWLAPSMEGDHLLMTNLTGHPAVVVPNGMNLKDGHPASITFHGRLFGEGKLLAAADAYQRATEFHKARPKLE